MIDGVIVKELKQISDERGKIMHMLRCDDKHFEKFGEIYFSVVYPGVVKGWHVHKKMTLNYAVVSGAIKLALYDSRPKSPTYKEIQEIFIGEDNYCLVRIPAGVTNGFKGIGTKPAIVANCATLPHDPQEIVRIDPFENDIPYNWEIKHK
ncbi:MAG: dTDP-4-dehydrorhamnose 3,5-epimerase family protein [Candidatus Omnitrophica bacterium]|nr:dTDP-4-dehydrorhamnose 3,5-epimerase family protein [Candidatus Omnitrophota bacterium]